MLRQLIWQIHDICFEPLPRHRGVATTGERLTPSANGAE